MPKMVKFLSLEDEPKAVPTVGSAATAAGSALFCAAFTRSILDSPGEKGKAKAVSNHSVFHVGLLACVVLYICIQSTFEPSMCEVESRMIDL